jgi:hypothetical protein
MAEMTATFRDVNASLQNLKKSEIVALNVALFPFTICGLFINHSIVKGAHTAPFGS